VDGAAAPVALVARKGIRTSGDDLLMKGHEGDASAITMLRQEKMPVKAKRRKTPNLGWRGKGKETRKHTHKETKEVTKATIRWNLQ
jgi:hypothetical protein